MMRAAVVGATGLVGRSLVEELLASPRIERSDVLARRELRLASDRVRCHVVDFDRLETTPSARDALSATAVFCCLGTTLKQAGSQAAFRKVDHDYPLAAARLALAAGARQLLTVTAAGADANSAFFYNRVKGELEAALRELAFPDGITLAHPSLLLGEREAPRPAERIASVFMRAARPLFSGPLLRYRAITATQVARALVTAACEPTTGVRILEGESLFAYAARS